MKKFIIAIAFAFAFLGSGQAQCVKKTHFQNKTLFHWHANGMRSCDFPEIKANFSLFEEDGTLDSVLIVNNYEISVNFLVRDWDYPYYRNSFYWDWPVYDYWRWNYPIHSHWGWNHWPNYDYWYWDRHDFRFRQHRFAKVATPVKPKEAIYGHRTTKPTDKARYVRPNPANKSQYTRQSSKYVRERSSYRGTYNPRQYARPKTSVKQPVSSQRPPTHRSSSYSTANRPIQRSAVRQSSAHRSIQSSHSSKATTRSSNIGARSSNSGRSGVKK